MFSICPQDKTRNNSLMLQQRRFKLNITTNRLPGEIFNSRLDKHLSGLTVSIAGLDLSRVWTKRFFEISSSLVLAD